MEVLQPPAAITDKVKELCGRIRPNDGSIYLPIAFSNFSWRTFAIDTRGAPNSADLARG